MKKNINHRQSLINMCTRHGNYFAFFMPGTILICATGKKKVI